MFEVHLIVFIVHKKWISVTGYSWFPKHHQHRQPRCWYIYKFLKNIYSSLNQKSKVTICLHTVGQNQYIHSVKLRDSVGKGKMICVFYNSQKFGFTTEGLWSKPPSSYENLPPKTQEES